MSNMDNVQLVCEDDTFCLRLVRLNLVDTFGDFGTGWCHFQKYDLWIKLIYALD